MARVFQLFLSTLLFLATAANDLASSPIIKCDICIIGGGSTGTYSAISLSDSGKSVCVVEAKDRLGGHTNTYTDPSTGETVDYGVVVFHNLTVVSNYFTRLNVSFTKSTNAAVVNKYVDFRTGVIVAGYAAPTPPVLFGAFAAYGAQLSNYTYLENGFDLPYPVPPDLLLPFGDFVMKYSLQGLMGFLPGFAQGLGNLLEQKTLYVFKNFGLGILQDIVTGFLTTTDQDNSEIYVKALAELKKLEKHHILLQSRVLATDRKGNGVKVLVMTPTGMKLIIAKKLLITIPPKLENLNGFDLSHNETSLFEKFVNSAYYTGLLRNTSIPDGTVITNVGANTTLTCPVFPGVYAFKPTRVSGLTAVKVGSPYALSDTEVKALIVDTVLKLKTGGTFNTTTPTFAAYDSHTPFELTVSKEDIEGGFYQRLYALQGQRHTWYTGAAFHTHDSSLLWQFTETILPSLLA